MYVPVCMCERLLYISILYYNETEGIVTCGEGGGEEREGGYECVRACI